FFSLLPTTPSTTLLPYTTLFRSVQNMEAEALGMTPVTLAYTEMYEGLQRGVADCAFQTVTGAALASIPEVTPHAAYAAEVGLNKDRKSTRLNSSHVSISYAVFCL